MKHGRQSRKRAKFGKARGWVAVGTLAAYAAMGGSRVARAAEKVDPSGAGAPGATLPLKRFNIAAGPLDAALANYEKTTGLKVKVTLPAGTLAGFTTLGVAGLYREDEALRLLLDGTGLSFRMEDGSTMVVGVEARDTVSVTAAARNDVAMTKFTQPLLDTPQSVSVVPTFVTKAEGVSTLRDTLRNVPGISLAAGESGAQGDNLTIRGFTARNDIFLDGIRDFGSYYRDSFNYEQVEALEGPAGVEFGRGSTGGVINQESKAPTMDRFAHVGAQFGTDQTRRVTVDLNAPLGDTLGGAAARLNVMAQQGGVAGRDVAEVRRFGIAPSISIGMETPTRATVSYLHLSEDDTPDYGLPWLNHALVQGVDRHSYFGFADNNYLKTNDDILTLRVSHDFSSDVTLHTIARAANYPRQAQITEPQLCSNAKESVRVGGFVSSLPTLAYNPAVACPYTDTTPASAITTVNRNQIQVKSVEGDLWDQTEVVAHFRALRLRHTLVAGVEGGQEISNPVRTSYTINKINSVAPTTLLGPDEDGPFSGTGYVSSIVHTKSESVGLYFVDTIKLGRLFEASGGVRWDRFDTRFSLYQPKPPAGGTVSAPIGPISQVVAEPSYRAALVYKPSARGSVYFDYGTSFNPSAESLSLSVSTSILPPEENQTYEAGTKWNFLNEHLMLDGAFFRTEKDNARETDPTNSNNIVLAGNQLVKGVQMSVVGRMPEGMDIVAGYAYLDSAVIFSKFFPTAVGFPLANVPKQTFNLFVTHRLPLRLNAGLGGNYVAARTASSTVPFVPTAYGPAQTFAPGTAPCGATATKCYEVLATAMKQVPGYWVFNAMLRRPVTDRLELQANVYNLMNRFYIDLPHPSHLVPGPGVSALVGVNFKF
ncbi:TonB-dependent receptor domain-containing protein [Edaphobacter sp.]|uniref:TonB-dependent receptor domain-containing protein n=1 Tax=Edaphobacter sp. TaxID=1934404 RepID=UPI002DB7B00E|nr:TonB-dependent receptor [Edaphobacter sp.]HEU5342125.1 TonB-dependent receptor [Edaphobacter sp.]